MSFEVLEIQWPLLSHLYLQLTMHKSGSNAASAFMLDPCSFGKKRAMTV